MRRVVPGFSTDYEGKCGSCHRSYQSEDVYCRYCGTKIGEGSFEPYMENFACIYGPPPVKRSHECKNCGYKWETHLMLDREKFCPKCGNSAPAINDD